MTKTLRCLLAIAMAGWSSPLLADTLCVKVVNREARPLSGVPVTLGGPEVFKLPRPGVLREHSGGEISDSGRVSPRSTHVLRLNIRARFRVRAVTDKRR